MINSLWTKAIISTLAFAGTVACERAALGDDPTFSYVVPSADSHSNGVQLTFDECELAGPKETLVLARLEAPFTQNTYECGETRDYWRLANKTKLSILKQSGPTQVPGTIDSVWFFEWAAPGLNSETPMGTTVVASVRAVSGEWFVTGVVEVNIGQNNASAAGERVNLPDRWSVLSDRVADTRAAWPTRCDHTDDLHGAKLMNDTDFDALVHDGSEVVCLPTYDTGFVGSSDAG